MIWIKKSEELGGKAKFFTKDYSKYAWNNLLDASISGFELVNIYGEAIQSMNQNPNLPQLFRDIFKNAYLPYRYPETLKAFLKIIDDFRYDHSERLGDAFEYLLSVMVLKGMRDSLEHLGISLNSLLMLSIHQLMIPY